MRKFVFVSAIVVLFALLLPTTTHACPPGGCVEILASPSEDGDYYMRIAQDNGVITSFTPNAVTVSGGRRSIDASFTFDEDEIVNQGPITLTYTLAEYDSSWNYIGVIGSGAFGTLSVYDPPGGCSDPADLCSDHSAACQQYTSCHWGSYYCAAYNACVLDMGYCAGGDCVCDASDVDFCPNVGAGEGTRWGLDDCPPFKLCLVSVSAWSEF